MHERYIRINFSDTIKNRELHRHRDVFCASCLILYCCLCAQSLCSLTNYRSFRNYVDSAGRQSTLWICGFSMLHYMRPIMLNYRTRSLRCLNRTTNVCNSIKSPLLLLLSLVTVLTIQYRIPKLIFREEGDAILSSWQIIFCYND